jgi:hypothetical protein
MHKKNDFTIKTEDLKNAYQAMAADQARESNALEWSNGLRA